VASILPSVDPSVLPSVDPSILPTGMYLVFSVLLFFCDFKWSNTCSFALNIVVNIAVKCEYFVC